MVEIIKEEDYLKKILEERIYSNTKSIKKTSLLVSKIISNVAKKGDDALRNILYILITLILKRKV